MVKGRHMNCRIVAPSDVKKHLVNVTKLRWWQKKKLVSEMENGVWLEPMKSFLEEVKVRREVLRLVEHAARLCFDDR